MASTELKGSSELKGNVSGDPLEVAVLGENGDVGPNRHRREHAIE